MNTPVKVRGIDLYRWARQVKARDSYVCQECGEPSLRKNMYRNVAHHIKPIFDAPELTLDINNGRTLCRSCHVKIHLSMIKENKTGGGA